MSKKIKSVEQKKTEKKCFQHGDHVMYSSIGIRSTVIGKSVTEKGVYVLELSDGTLETASGDELEFVDFVREYDDGMKEGAAYAVNIRQEILMEAREYATDRSHDFAQAYLTAVSEGLADIPNDISDVLEEEEE
jgi:hypothetical protein